VWSILATGELDEFELDLFFMVLTFAGSETTRNTLSQGLIALLDHPDQLAELRQDPSLLPTAAEEVLRWSSPVLCFARTVARDIKLSGQQLHTGDRVGLFYPSANRDKKVFADPFRFELKVMIGALLRRFDVIEITGEPTWMSAGPAAAVGVAVQSLPVRLA
jgi:cytochrome P450